MVPPDAPHDLSIGRDSRENPKRSYGILIDQHARAISAIFRLSRTIMSLQFTTYPRTDFIASIGRRAENSVYSYQARPAYRNAISPTGGILRDGVSLKIAKEETFLSRLPLKFLTTECALVSHWYE